jgi:hypothetical protein
MKLKFMGLFIVVGLLIASSIFLPGVIAQDTSGTKAEAAKAQAGAKTAKMEADKAQQAASGAADTNVKTDTATNSKGGQTPPAPPEKGGEKGKGMGPGYVEVVFNNYSPWYVKCFVDGNYRGTVAPWGALDFPTGNGPTMLYARADFDDGSSYRWGPRQFFYYTGNRYQWRLNP